ncbi:MAG: tetratricopeptide repeat protein, partial [Planctomycetota bacterium]
NILQLRAQRLIGEAIGRPGIEVGIETLFEAATGYYNNQEFQAAVEALRDVRASITDEADATLYTPRILNYIGRSFYRQERYLEAAMAYREAIRDFAGDAEYDELNAEGYYRSISRVRKRLEGDDQIEDLYRESETLMTSLGADPGTIVYRQGVRAFEAEDYNSARESFLSVDRAAPVYEKAVVKAARCLQELGDLDGALREFDAYIDDFVGDPSNRIPRGETGPLQQRDEALAEANYYKGQVFWSQQDYDRMTGLYSTLPEQFESQPGIASAALSYCIRASLNQEDLPRAKSFHDRLLSDFPDNDFTGQGATLLFNYAKERFDAAKAAGDDELGRQMKGEMAFYSEVSNNLRGEPVFGYLLSEAGLWFDFENWEKAAEDYATVMRLFGNTEDPDDRRRIERIVVPQYGYALLELRRVPEAFELVANRVPASDDSQAEIPPKRTIEVFCRSVSGWVTGDPRNPEIVPGVGGAENFAKAAPWWSKLATTYDKWVECDWYHCQFNKIWTFHQWGKVDSAVSETAKKAVEQIRSQAGSDFRFVEEHCGEDSDLRERFNWIARQV